MIDIAERRRRLMHRHHLLADQASSLEQVVHDMVGLHSSDPATVFISIGVRTGLRPPRIEEALYESRTLVRLHGMRRTLWVMTRHHAAMVQAVVSPMVADAERRRLEKGLVAAGLDDDPRVWASRVMDALEAVIRDRPGISTRALSDLVPETSQPVMVGGPKWGGEVPALSRLVYLLAMDGRIVRDRPAGSWVSGQYSWTISDVDVSGLDPASTRTRLVSDWLRAFGPATFDDLVWWFGWGVRTTRSALSGLEHETIDSTGPELLLRSDDADPTPSHESTCVLLPSLDPSVMGWKHRDWILGDHAGRLFDPNGNAGPIVMLDGRAVGTWGQTPGGSVVTELFDDGGVESRSLAEQAAGDLESWLGGVVVRPRFASPASRDLMERLGP